MSSILDKFKKRNTVLEETIKTPEGQRFLELRKKYNIQQKPIIDAERLQNTEDNIKITERQLRYLAKKNNEKKPKINEILKSDEMTNKKVRKAIDEIMKGMKVKLPKKKK
jgi:ABC-type antimicrobial peptide transport system permease subunit